jgi:hypothetical protein
LSLDAIVLFLIPRLSEPRGVEYALGGIRYLQEHLGLQRFYTLGPIAPNYASYFGIASINHNDVPISVRWTDFIKEHLHAYLDSPSLFIGTQHYEKSLPSPEAELRRNLEWYQWVGVKYVVKDAPTLFAGTPLVYRDAAMAIFELPDAKPYFEAPDGGCRLVPDSRTSLLAECRRPAQIVRRELFFPGWSATRDGSPLPIDAYGELFQAVTVPAGTSHLAFEYAPVHARAGFWCFLLGVVGTAAAFALTLRRG